MKFRTLILAAAAMLICGAGIAGAEAPMKASSPPDFHRIMLGNFEVTALNDGTVDLPMDKLMQDISPTLIHEALAARFMRLPVETSVNAFLVNTGKSLVLIDTGAGHYFGPTLGNLVASLKAAGYTPAQVDHVLITHMHADHVGGLSADGKRVFPNATVHVDKRDADYWLSTGNRDQADESRKNMFDAAIASFAPYQKAGKLATFSGATPIVDGIRSIDTHGHTPGHSSYQVESDGHRLIVWGDIVHLAAVQFDHPDATIAFDSDPALAKSQRLKLFDTIVSDHDLVAAAHIAFPGMGHIRKLDQGYQWVPLNYTRIR